MPLLPPPVEPRVNAAPLPRACACGCDDEKEGEDHDEEEGVIPLRGNRDGVRGWGGGSSVAEVPPPGRVGGGCCSAEPCVLSTKERALFVRFIGGIASTLSPRSSPLQH